MRKRFWGPIILLMVVATVLTACGKDSAAAEIEAARTAAIEEIEAAKAAAIKEIRAAEIEAIMEKADNLDQGYIRESELIVSEDEAAQIAYIMLGEASTAFVSNILDMISNEAPKNVSLPKELSSFEPTLSAIATRGTTDQLALLMTFMESNFDSGRLYPSLLSSVSSARIDSNARTSILVAMLNNQNIDIPVTNRVIAYVNPLIKKMDYDRGKLHAETISTAMKNSPVPYVQTVSEFINIPD